MSPWRPSRLVPLESRSAFLGIFVVTMLGLLAIGATLPVLPTYVKGPLGSTDLAVGIVSGAFAATGLAFRPIAGHLADSRGRRPVVVIGAAMMALAGSLYLIDLGIPGLIFARLFLGAGEGMVYTAGAAWVVDLAPPHSRGQIIGLYGISIWLGLSLGPPIGELLLRASSFDLVWAFAALSPLIGAIIASRLPEPAQAIRGAREGSLLAREAVAPGIALALGVVGYAALAAFIVLHLDAEGIGHGGEVFTAFALTVVAARLFAGSLPDRIGAARCAALMGAIETAGLLAISVAGSLAVTLLGAIAMGAAFSLLFPSLAVLVVAQVDESRRGIAMGTFTAFFDIGVGIGSPLAGAAVGLGGYSAAFAVASIASIGSMLVALSLRDRIT